MKTQEIYDKVTTIIVDQLNAGIIPWEKPWNQTKDGAELPMNYKTRKPYNGVNSLILSCMPYERPYYLTYNQATELKGQVRKGEKSVIVVYWEKTKYSVTNKKGEEEEKNGMFLKVYNVFNIAQIDGVDWKLPELVKVDTTETQRIEACENVISGYKNGPKLQVIASNQAYYQPVNDLVNMPLPTQFKKIEGYYQTFFHELIHSTGNSKRLNRKDLAESNGFGSESYSKEELTAELGASFLSKYAGIDLKNTGLERNTVAYLQSWIKKLKEQPKMILEASNLAGKAANYILGLD